LATFINILATRDSDIDERGEATMFNVIRKLFCAGVPIFVVALAGMTVPMTALAGTIYDGDWSVLILTRAGACEPSLRYGVQIADGMIGNDGASLARVQGRITPSGTVRVTVQAGSQWADGSGLLGRNRGGGAWRGQGTNGTCRGSWVAERRD
jgi:hypothetical protein